MKVVYNACFGGFSLSDAAVRLGRELSGDPGWNGPCLDGDVYEDGTPVRDRRFPGMEKDWNHSDLPRNDPTLVRVVEQLGEEANGHCAELRIADVPAGKLWRIDEYDGSETVMTQEDYDWQIAT